jgi:hypothetical protein
MMLYHLSGHINFDEDFSYLVYAEHIMFMFDFFNIIIIDDEKFHAPLLKNSAENIKHHLNL